LQGRIVLLVPIGTRARQFLERGDALRRHRMRLQIGIGTARGEQAVVVNRLKVSYMPFADWPVAVKNFTPARSAFSSCWRT
jgi:hypothetical protein